MSRYDGLIIPRSYNDYFSRSDPAAIRDVVAAATDAELDTESAAPIQNQAVAKLVPAAASEENQLADKNFVNSTVGTNTAIFRGTFDSVEELEAYAGEKTNNDYAFVIGEDSAGNTEYNRYKYDGTAWEYEYTLNNSSFTAEQWAAIQSGITAELVAKIGDAGLVSMTTGDYNELPEEEKNANKIYLLTDAQNGFVAITDTVEAGNMAAVTSNAVEKEKIFSKVVTIGDIAVSGNNYLNIYNDTENIEIISVALDYWSQNTGAFSLIPYNNKMVYLIAQSGFSIKGLRIKIYYKKAA